MEPRIQSLLLDDNFSVDKLPPEQLPSPLGAYGQHHQHAHHGSRPAPVEPSAPRAANFSLHDIYTPTTKDSHDVFASQRPARPHHPAESGYSASLPHEPHHNGSRPPKSVPLAEVLNTEQASSGFSGSVNELLLDDDGASRKRRKVDGNEVFTLPKPQLPVKKGNRRPRIPPLLQGLHQPPPDAGLFPPITGERVAREAPKPQPLAEPKPAEASAERDASTGKAAKTRKLESSRRRKRWTEQETTHLLRGVARFGIGNWKKILTCPDYSFNGRTAVDLKDRFRTCCPDEYRRLKKPKDSSAEKASGPAGAEACPAESLAKPVSSLVASNILLPGSPTSVSMPEKKKRGPKVHRKDSRDLASIGIDVPFAKKARRERREFTEEEDAALLRGFEKLGPHWHSIRNDPDSELTHRHPTDLRDRLRNRWPEKYAEAGYKIKLKENKNNKQDKEDADAGKEARNEKAPATGKTPQDDTSALAASNAPPQSNPSSSSRPRAPDLKALLSNYPFPDPFTDDDDFASDLPFEGECSPVILSREIFSYAHPSNGQPSGSLDLPFVNADHNHINPLDTLKIPRLSGSTQSHSNTSLPPVWLSAPLTAGLSASGSGSGSGSGSVSGAGSRSMGAGATSGSGTVSLPGPADLLLGLDLDGRNDGHGSTFLWDEGP